MKTSLALAGLALVLLPAILMAAPTKMHKAAKPTAATMYQCSKCHMKVSAAAAKKDHYKDAMDGGKFVPINDAVGTGKPVSGIKK